jgi:hypothetical protein
MTRNPPANFEQSSRILQIAVTIRAAINEKWPEDADFIAACMEMDYPDPFILLQTVIEPVIARFPEASASEIRTGLALIYNEWSGDIEEAKAMAMVTVETIFGGNRTRQ